MTVSEVDTQLFTDVAGYSLSSQGKLRIGRDADPALTYGECTPEGVGAILAAVSPQPGEVFYDLGSGTGKMLIYAAFLHPFSKVVGIELLPELNEVAMEVGARYTREIQPQFKDERRMTKVEYRLGDIFDADLSDADIVVSHCCTCFDDTLMQRLSDALERCKSGTRIVTITRGLSSPAFESIGTAACQMGWGQATINAYRRM